MSTIKKKPRLLVFYHYFYPDNVVSSHHLSELSEELQKRGWEVIAMPCNRGCRDETKKFKAYENWNGIEIHRIRRPRFRQSSAAGRILNAIWMISAWSIVAFRKKKVPDIDVLVIGTDPVLSVLVAKIWKLVRPDTRIAHWCFDLYPEAPIAEGILKADSLLVKAIKKLLKSAYKDCDIIADIGDCMRDKLRVYGISSQKVTLVPWALKEPQQLLPVDTIERKKCFGDARLAISYSGNFGRAHSYELFLELARRLRGQGIKFAFSIRGNRADELKKSINSDDDNISFVPFAPMERLEARLSASDIHLTSLKTQWAGIVVPSKFFGSLAIGRPVMFAGSSKSALAKWIDVYEIGWVLTKENLDSVAEELIELSNDSERLKQLQKRCYSVYQQNFSKKQIANQWDLQLRA